MLTRESQDMYADDTLGGRISLARDAAGLSAQDAARQLGVLTSSWNDWESDRNTPRANRLTMMAGLLGVSPAWLLDGVGSGPKQHAQPANPADLLRDFRQVSDEVASLNKRMQKIAAGLELSQGAASREA